MASNPRFDPKAPHTVAEGVPLGGSRDQAMQRLRLGLAGLTGMLIIIGLASLIYEQANQVDATAVPEAAPTTEPSPAAPKNDPLADAGVVPDLPAEPSGGSSQQPAVMPEKGNAAPAQ